MSAQDGGPAFPAPAGVQHITTQGMSLRDYFAAAALRGIATSPSVQNFKLQTLNELTQWSYAVADAMLAERARKEAQP